MAFLNIPNIRIALHKVAIFNIVVLVVITFMTVKLSFRLFIA